MAFLIPCDDIIADIAAKPHSLDINPSLIVIGYQETNWNNNAPIHTCPFSSFQSLIGSNNNITVDNVVYIKYVDVDLWHKTNNIDRINGSGTTPKTETWHEIKQRYAHLLKQAVQADDDKKDNDDTDEKKSNVVRLHIEQNPDRLPGQNSQAVGYRRSYYYYRWRNPADDIIKNGYYEMEDKHTGKSTKINIEKLLKKSYKKTKLYHESTPFKFLTAEQLDNVYRIYEQMQINIINCSSLHALYRVEADSQREFKKLCVLNVRGVENAFTRNSTLDHSLSRYSSDLPSTADDSDEADQYLYTNTMVYSPHCVVFNDVNGALTPSYHKVSFLTVYPVHAAEYYRVKRRVFDQPEMEDKFKKLDEKLANQNLNKKSKRHHHQQHNQGNKNKSKKRTEEETQEFVAKLNEMQRTINHIQQERIRRMIEIAIYNGCDAIVFDAYGCQEGSGNDVTYIAEIFAKFMKTVYYNCFRSVTFTMTGTDCKQNGNHHAKGKKQEVDHISAFKAFQQAFESQFAV
mmetsp:Transcript_3893/g.6544  ORF Transcript_3893/g.6544 Transcript_3893/m.6544 type:complete len:515 (+) Transcript_3893:166-1710(+)